MNKALFFDFDGVVLNSVRVKTQAFYQLLLPHGKEIAEKAVDYHIAHGGVSRYEKFKHYYKEYLDKEISTEELAELGDKFSALVLQGVLDSEYIPGFLKFINNVQDQFDCYVISGTPQKELEHIVKGKGLLHYFKAVYGSPRKKAEILEDILKNKGYMPKECLFFGDAITDLNAAKSRNIPFVLVLSEDNEHLVIDSDQVINKFDEVKLPT